MESEISKVGQVWGSVTEMVALGSFLFLAKSLRQSAREESRFILAHGFRASILSAVALSQNGSRERSEVKLLTSWRGPDRNRRERE